MHIKIIKHDITHTSGPLNAQYLLRKNTQRVNSFTIFSVTANNANLGNILLTDDFRIIVYTNYMNFIINI
jgi:hypothetical protein